MATPQEPRELFSGRYTLFENPDGGYHLSYLVDGDDEVKHFELPAAVMAAVKMAAQQGVNPLSLMRMLRNGRG